MLGRNDYLLEERKANISKRGKRRRKGLSRKLGAILAQQFEMELRGKEGRVKVQTSSVITAEKP